MDGRVEGAVGKEGVKLTGGGVDPSAEEDLIPWRLVLRGASDGEEGEAREEEEPRPT